VQILDPIRYGLPLFNVPFCSSLMDVTKSRTYSRSLRMKASELSAVNRSRRKLFKMYSGTRFMQVGSVFLATRVWASSRIAPTDCRSRALRPRTGNSRWKKADHCCQTKVQSIAPIETFCEMRGLRDSSYRRLGPRSKQKYPRYWCRKPGCRAVKLSSEQLEGEVLTFLGRLRPTTETIADFPKIAARVWEERQGDSEKEMKGLSTSLEEQTRLKSELLKMRMRGELSREEFEQANAELAVERYSLEEQIRLVHERRGTAESFVNFAELSLTDIAHVWKIASPEQKQKVQNLPFEDGLDYSHEKGILNRSNSSLFSTLEAMNAKNGLLVGPEGFEPPTKGL
jgi:hypothetical protein